MFKFHTYLHYRCHYLLMISKRLSDIASLKIKNADYHCIVTAISISDAINVMLNIDLTEKSGILQKDCF